MENELLDKSEENIVAASFGRRLIAWIIDIILLSIPSRIAQSVFGGDELKMIQDSIIEKGGYSLVEVMDIYVSAIPNLSGVITITMIINWLYYALMESSDKQATLGKIALNIKVVDETGEKVSFGKATGRYFARIITGFTFLIGYLMMIFNQKSQTLHDLIAKCLVIEKRK